MRMQFWFSSKSGRSSPPPDVEEGALTLSDEEATSTDAAQRGGVNPHRRYHTLLRRSRLTVLAFWAAMAYFLFRAIPWLPGGLSEDDYNAQLTATLVLGGVCAALGIGALVFRENLRRTREAVLAWSTVYDDTTGLYNRRYFYDRLALECERARRQSTTFSLILMRLEHSAGSKRGPSPSALRRLAAALTRAARSNDLVALLGGNELAVVAMGVSGKALSPVADRLKTALEGSLNDSGERLDLRLGVASYGSRSRHPSVLLRAARQSLSRKPPSEEAADKKDLAA
jgi:diguanylate cyclase (GGDEF)-like protein